MFSLRYIYRLRYIVEHLLSIVFKFLLFFYLRLVIVEFDILYINLIKKIILKLMKNKIF